MDDRLKLLSVALLVVPAGYTGGAADGGAGSAGGAESASLTAGASGSAGAEQMGGDNPPQAQRQAVIRNGQIELTIDEFDKSRDAVESTVESYGGYISDSNEYVNRRSGDTYRSNQLVVRIPSGDFSAFITDIKALDEVERVEASPEDVTDRLIDIGARLSNLRTQRDHLHDLYESANTTEDMLVVEKRLADVQTKIERLETQKQSLEGRVALSAIRVSLSGQPPGPTQWYDTPVLQTFSKSVNGAFVALQALVITVTYAISYLIVFGGPLAILGSGVMFAGRAAFRRLTG